MNILAFDTSSTACSIALQFGDQVKVSHQIAPMQQTKLLLPMLQELLDSFSIKLNQLDAIAYGCGPGSFTGTRIASSVAQGLGFAVKLPVIKISSLAAIAEAAFIERRWEKLLVAIDARMGKVYWAIYQKNDHDLVELIGQEEACMPDQVHSDLIVGSDWYGIGDGWTSYKEILSNQVGVSLRGVAADALPTAEAVLALAKEKFMQGDWVELQDVTPVYLS